MSDYMEMRTKAKEIGMQSMQDIKIEISSRMNDILIEMIRIGMEPIDAMEFLNDELEDMKFRT